MPRRDAILTGVLRGKFRHEALVLHAITIRQINLQVRFIAAHNTGVYILRVERENLFVLLY